MTSEIVAELDRCLSGAVSLDELEQWIVSNLQATMDTKDGKAIALIDDVDALLMQSRNGEIDELDLVESMDALVRLQQTIQRSVPVGGTSTIEDNWVLGVDDETIARVAIVNEFVSEIRPPQLVFE